MSTFQPYGGLGWPLACLLPPSAISLFATVLLKLEGSQRGVQWDTLHLQMTSQYPFSAATVFQMLALDVVLYTGLAWYFDKVAHRSSARDSIHW
jgi:ATP-binding cassette subfamily A (ABC1) protein 1/ATP-binding cassette subfamily A (ABC1) protein 3